MLFIWIHYIGVITCQMCADIQIFIVFFEKTDIPKFTTFYQVLLSLQKQKSNPEQSDHCLDDTMAADIFAHTVDFKSTVCAKI